MTSTTSSFGDMVCHGGPSRPDSAGPSSSMPQSEIEPSNLTPTVTTISDNGTPSTQSSPFLSLPWEIRHQIYKNCNQSSMSLTHTLPPSKSTNYLEFKHIFQSALYALSRTCQLIHTDLQNTNIFPQIHLGMGAKGDMDAGPFVPEHPTFNRVTYSEVLRYLNSSYRVVKTTQAKAHANSGIPPHILQNIIRITIFDSFARYVPVASFRSSLSNLQGVTMVMPRLYPRELQSLVGKGRPERWVEKLVTKGYRSLLSECPDTIDWMKFSTVRNFDCLTCFGAGTKLHAVGITVTVSTSTWTVIELIAKNGTFKDRDRESHQTSRKKGERRRETWEGYECLCDFHEMVAWWLGLDVGGKRNSVDHGDGDRNGGQHQRAEFGRDYLDEFRDLGW